MPPSTFMIYLHFRDDEVAAYLEVAGYAYVQGTDQDAAILRALERFSEKTDCLFDDQITLTTAAQSSYALRSTDNFAKKVYKIQDVWVGGNKLRRVASQQDMARIQESYRSETGTPSHWWTQGQELVLFPTPTGVIADSYVSGWFLHSAVGDNDDMEIPDSDIDAAAKYVATEIMDKRATGEVRDHMQRLAGEAKQEMGEIKARAIDLTVTPAKRRTNKTYVLS